MTFQVDPVFAQAVKHVCTELRKVGLPKFMVDRVSQATTIEAATDAVGRAVDDYHDKDSLVKKFSTDGIDKDVLTEGNSASARITPVQAQAIQVQLTFLRELRRHYGFRKLSRSDKIIRAAHRRAIVSGENGPVTSALLAQVLRVLAQQ